MKVVTSGITRPDTSKSDLNNYKSQGFETVVFVTNIEADPACDYLNGNIYSIEELLTLDNPIYRISHPNCRCRFDGYGKTKTAPTHTETGPTFTTTPKTQPTQFPTTTPTPSTLPTEQKEQPKQTPWYKKWYEKFMPDFLKKKTNYRHRILKRAKYAEQVRTAREILLSRKKGNKQFSK